MAADGFLSLADFLRPNPAVHAIESAGPQPIAVQCEAIPGELEEALSAARRFRAGLADALEAILDSLLREIARQVLARELLLRPADIRGIVDDALAKIDGERVLTLRVHPSDAGAIEALELECVGDTALERGDVVLHLRSGTIDLALATRLDSVVSASLARS